MSRDRHMAIWTNRSPADVLRPFPCVNVKLIHVDRSDRKMSMSPDLNTGVRDIKTEPIAAQLAIPPQSYLCFDPVPPRAFVNLHRLTFAKWSDKVGSVLGRRGARGTIQQRSSSGLRCLPEAIVSSPGMGGDGHCLTLSMQHFVCFIP